MSGSMFRRVLALPVAFLLLAACEDDPAAPAATENTIRIGAALSLSGALGLEGNEARRGYELWRDWVNIQRGGMQVGGQQLKVELILYDDESDAARSAQLVERLITQDGVDFLLGPYGSDATLTTSAVAEQHGVLMVAGNGASESIFERGFQNVFAVLTSARLYTRSAIEQLAELGAGTVVIAHEETGAFSRSVAEGAADWAAEFDFDVLDVLTYPRAASDLGEVVAAAQALQPDVFIAGGYFNDAVLFRQTAAELGFSPAAMLLTVGPAIPEFVVELGNLAEHVLGPTQWEESMAWEDAHFGTAAQYGLRYRARYGTPPTYQAAQSTAAALVLQLALEDAGTLATAQVRDALRRTDIMTFYGPIRFDESGRNVAKPMGITQVQSGQIVLVAPPEMAVAPWIYPAFD